MQPFRFTDAASSIRQKEHVNSRCRLCFGGRKRKGSPTKKVSDDKDDKKDKEKEDGKELVA